MHCRNINVADAGAGGDGGGSAAIEINWDIDVSAAGAEAAESQQQAGGDASSLTGAAAGKRSAASAALGPDERAALRLERDADYRALLLDDLQELRAFLLVRRGDMASSTGFAFVAAAPQAVRDVDASSVRSMLAAVDAALEHLRSQRLQQLLLIAGSRSYLDRLVAGLQRRGGQEARMLAASRESEARRNESKGQLVGLAPKVAQMVERMREIKGHVERTVGAQLGGRRVNVLGDINTVLASTST